eukprot:4470252-Amphidinium_carterae.1
MAHPVVRDYQRGKVNLTFTPDMEALDKNVLTCGIADHLTSVGMKVALRCLLLLNLAPVLVGTEGSTFSWAAANFGYRKGGKSIVDLDVDSAHASRVRVANQSDMCKTYPKIRCYVFGAPVPTTRLKPARVNSTSVLPQ